MDREKDNRPSLWIIVVLVLSMLVSACSAPANGTPPAQEEAQPPATQAEPTAAQPTAQQAASQPTATQAEQATAENTPSQPETATAVPESSGAAGAASIPDPAGFTWTTVASGLETPVDIASANDGSGRLFVLEKLGVIRIIQDGTLAPEPFMDITDRVVIGGNEMGLLGIAFHPKFSENGYFYVNYTAVRGVGETHISRFQVSADDPNRGDPGSEKLLLKVDQPYRNHNGGGLAFGPDGFLYIALGDGGSANDPNGNGQSLDTHLGKLLRIDVDNGDPYAIPADNPFANGGGKPEIWAYGLRNPWRFSFDRQTSDLWIADVGQNEWEEVNFTPAGSPGGINFGWDYREASQPFEGQPPAGLELVDPVFEYKHGLGCSVTGGFVYRGEALPEFNGVYVVADFCSGRIWGVAPDGSGSWQSQELFLTGINISSFGQDEQGELYLADMTNGTILRLDRQ